MCSSSGKSSARSSPVAMRALTARPTRSATTSDSSVTPFSAAFASSIERPRPSRMPTSRVRPP